MNNNIYLSEINKLKNKPWINKIILKKFIKRLKHPLLVKEDSPTDHICVFFLPIDVGKKQIYLCHHIKAQDWIPPGGHIDKNEHPTNTVIREFQEELNFILQKTTIKLFDLSIKDVRSAGHGCRIHWDIWYLVLIGKIDFDFTKKEYYNARWVTIPEANKLCKYNPLYLKIINKIPNIIFNLSDN